MVGWIKTVHANWGKKIALLQDCPVFKYGYVKHKARISIRQHKPHNYTLQKFCLHCGFPFMFQASHAFCWKMY